MLDDLRFTNSFTSDLPGDPSSVARPRQVHQAAFSRVRPTPVAAPVLVAHSAEIATALGLTADDIASPRFAAVFGGNELLEGMDPYAMCYGGHQFGHWAGQLGDGRAIALGEITTDAGARLTLQLKGAGRTPYSRTADGLAVLRSSVREFLCSEAMFHLGVPTTRALSLVLTGEEVLRDMFYDGRAAMEPGAIVCRVASSFVRFGSFELPASRGDTETLRALADHVVTRDYPHLGAPSKEVYAAMFREVCLRTADMIVHWMRVGFVHGVMNTDNMSILGETIDYGPYGWLEDYDPDWTPNTTDREGRRYRFSHQPQVAHWNLMQLANALYALIEDDEPLRAALDAYADSYESKFQDMMAAKLGLRTYVEETDKPLILEVLRILQLAETDMTIFFRKLADLDLAAPSQDVIADAYYVPDQRTAAVRAEVDAWLRRYAERARADVGDRAERMNRVNPKYVLRNYMAQVAIDKAAAGDHSEVALLLDLLRRPYDEQPDREKYAAKRPDWARTRAGCSMLSCSS